MSLSRQLISLIALLLVLVFAGTLSINIANTRSYLETQLESHAQDTATSLGLSLAPAIAEGDKALAASTVDAVFDRGYYRRIVVRAMDGTEILRRENDIGYAGVPGWFIDAIPLEAPVRETTVTNGWRQVGTVEVASHPGYAYRELWLTTVHNCWWLLGLALLSLAAVSLIVRFVLRPLRAMERQAVAIADRHFVTQDYLPRTPELRRVVEAMNGMSGKLHSMVEAQTELTDQLRARAYEDALTGLQNRRSFEERLQHLVKSSEEFQSGVLALVSVSSLDAVNDALGYAAGDQVLQEIAQRLAGAGARFDHPLVARIGGAEFALLVGNVSPEEARELAEHITGALETLHVQGHIQGAAVSHTGLAYFDGRQSATELLAAADTALRAAQGEGANRWQFYDDRQMARLPIRSASDWRQLLEQCMQDRALELHFQPVRACEGEQLLHWEVLSRLLDEDGSAVPAGVFMPMAERHGLAPALDRTVVEAMEARLPGWTEGRYAVNIAPSSLRDPDFIDWLCERLQANPELAGRTIFETAEYGAASEPGSLAVAAERIRGAGSQFSLDHFGTGAPSFGYLRYLTPDYIKIDGSYVRGIHREPDNQFFVRSLCEIAHGLDIRFIAQSVETEADWQTLRELGVDGVQGHAVGSPRSEAR